MQRNDVQHNNARNQEWHQIVQREEPVQCWIINREPAPQEGHNRLAEDWNSRKQVGDHCGAPEAHLAPRQHISHERGCHHEKEDHDTQHPQQFTRRLVGAVIQTAEDVDVHNDEEETRRIHMDVANKPAMVHVTHDPLDRAERVVDMGGVAHCQNNTCHDHDDQRQTGKNAKVPEIVQVLWHWVMILFVLHHREDGKTVVNPSYDGICKLFRRHGLSSLQQNDEISRCELRCRTGMCKAALQG